MKKVLNISIIVLVAVFIGIQFVPKDYPENLPVTESDLIQAGNVPGDVAEILRNSCYDCHSSQINYPWYSHIAPASWLLEKDIKEGIEHLNFSEWHNYSLRAMIGNLEEIREEVGSNAMPLPVYTVIHRKAKLTEEQKEAIARWTEEMTVSLLK